MKLLTSAIRDKLLENGETKLGLDEKGETYFDPIPVVKLFTPDAAGIWLLTELFPDDPNIAFGLCDLGMGFPELGSVCISALEDVRGAFGLPIERDCAFRPRHPISVYARTARYASAITENRASLVAVAFELGRDSASS